MGKRNFLIAILIGIVIIFGVVVWAFLRPALQASAENSRLNNDAWKLERVAGTWASEDEKTIIDIDGYDFTLKIDGVYALIATFSFDAATQSQDFDARFDMQIDPDSCIYPDANGASSCKLDEMWYENGTISASSGAQGENTQNNGLEPGEVPDDQMEPQPTTDGEYGSSVAGADGIVPLDVLITAGKYCNEHRNEVTYEQVYKMMGNVHGAAQVSASSWKTGEIHQYAWMAESGEYIYINFHVADDGAEYWSSMSSTMGLLK